MRERKVSKSHAKGVIVLIFSILAIQLVIYLFSLIYKGDFSLKTRNVAIISNADTSAEKLKTDSNKIKRERFKFDPNKLDEEGFMRLGFTQSQVKTIIKFRTKIGGFKSKGDFAKLYVVPESLYNELENYIVFEKVHKKGLDHKMAVNGAINSKGVQTYAVTNQGNSQSRNEKFETGNPESKNLDTRSYKSVIKDVASNSKKLIELNSADSTELVSLPGIGPYFASKILNYRERLGGFAIKEQLFDIYGIDDQKFEMISSKIVIDTLSVKKFDLSVATEKELSKHPYIGGYVARGIVRFREKAGSVLCTLEVLIANKIIKEEFASILRFYCK